MPKSSKATPEMPPTDKAKAKAEFIALYKNRDLSGLLMFGGPGIVTNFSVDGRLVPADAIKAPDSEPN